MKFVPHDYQAFAVDHILSHEVSALFLDMGLGKTAITLTAIESLMYRSFEVRKVLVVAPLRVAKNTWPAELAKWDHLRGMTCSVAVGPAEERLTALRRKADIYLINRENIPWLVEKSGLPFDYDMLVVDELSSFKSWQARRFRSLMKVRPFVKRVVGLTGTPSPNGFMDLFAEYRLLDMGERLGRFIGRYREAYFIPERLGNGRVFSWKLRSGADEAIFRKISDITVSMKSVDHLNMPECLLNEVPVRMDGRERKLYETLKKELFLRVLNRDGLHEVDAKNASVLCNKLVQMANGAVYSEGGEVLRIHDRKLDALEDLIEGANGNPMLISYWFQHDILRIQERFPHIRVLRSPEDIQKWNLGKIPVAAIHPASCGHGLNLQSGGSTVVWFGLTWSLELYLQTNARLWRQGQKANTVVIHHLVTEGTIDERILRALKGKDARQETLLDAVKAQIVERKD